MEKQIYSKVVDGITVEWSELTQWWVFPWFNSITLKGKIYIREAHEEQSDRLLRHESIHGLQQEEVGYSVFLLLYALQWLWAFLTFRDAYESIKFEREAYANQKKVGYLKTRPKNAWKKY